MTDTSSERCVLAYALYANQTNPLIGMVRPVAEIVGDKLVPITSEGFCRTMRVFITSHYDDLEKRFPDQQVFKLRVNLNNKKSEVVDSANTCEYVATANMAEDVKAKDYFEVIDSPLPDANYRAISLQSGNPITRFIFINNGENLYGPFRWKSNTEPSSIHVDFIDSPLPGVTLASFQTYQIELKNVIPLIVKSLESDSRTIIAGLDVIHHATFFDYASDAEIVKYCLKLQSDAGARIIEKSKVEALILQVLKSPRNSAPFIKHRLTRLPAIVERMTGIQNDLQESLLAAFTTDTGKEILGKFVEQNEARFLDRFKREKQTEIDAAISALELDQKNAQQRLNDIEIEKRQANDQLQELRNNIREENQSSKNEKVENAVAEANSTYQKLRTDISEIEAQITARKSQLDTLKTFEEIQKKIDAARSVEEYIKDEIKGLNDSKRLLQSEVDKSAEQLRAKLIELKPFVDSINGSYFPETTQERTVDVITFPFISSESLVNRQRDIVHALATQLAAQGRVLQDWEVANLLITTQQSFITVLAGLPGTGKTTLARLLAQVQGIRSRLQEVPVARGWTSQKDLIGYFNPLTSRFQPSSTGVYDYLRAISEETSADRAMTYTLLDEANLSPMEHYWSSFMDMADGKEDRILRLGQQSLSIPDCLRFIATINYDGTTEPLSQRLINRAPIVVIEESEITHSNTIGIKPEAALIFPISAMQMEELFGKSTLIPTFDPSEDACFQRIKKTLTKPDMALGRPVSISPRKEVAILHYCNKARTLMGEDNELAALDMAVLQHILPLVNGTGVRFKLRLEALKVDLEELTLPRSARYLDRMIAYGSQDLHSYDFFCW